MPITHDVSVTLLTSFIRFQDGHWINYSYIITAAIVNNFYELAHCDMNNTVIVTWQL